MDDPQHHHNRLLNTIIIIIVPAGINFACGGLDSKTRSINVNEHMLAKRDNLEWNLSSRSESKSK